MRQLNFDLYFKGKCYTGVVFQDGSSFSFEGIVCLHNEKPLVVPPEDIFSPKDAEAIRHRGDYGVELARQQYGERR